uniref:Uncharacterized protein n=1 Tax=Anguilla anguilla TaxID=7936 RepID=A0A0E9VCJ0_ANGAN
MRFSFFFNNIFLFLFYLFLHKTKLLES